MKILQMLYFGIKVLFFMSDMLNLHAMKSHGGMDATPCNVYNWFMNQRL